MKKQSKWVIGALCWSLSMGLSAATLEQVSVLLKQQQSDEALVLIRQHLAQSPQDAHWQYLQAQALAAQGHDARAEEVYRQLMVQQPRFLPAYNGLAQLLVERGRLDEAGQILERALTDTDPVYATLYRNLQSINVEIARASYGKALRVDVPGQRIALKPAPLIADKPTVVAAASQVDEMPETNGSVTSPSPTVPLANEVSAIKETVRDWASAWSEQQVSRYLSYYASGFQPDDGLSLAQWQQQRQVRLRRPQWIRIKLDKLTVAEQSAQLAVVEFVQHYESNTYSDVTNKQLILTREAQGWRIVQENTL